MHLDDTDVFIVNSKNKWTLSPLDFDLSGPVGFDPDVSG